MIAMQDLKTAIEVAEALNIHKATVNRIAAKHNIGKCYGERQNNRWKDSSLKQISQMRLFTKQDEKQIAKLCRYATGNPNFSRKIG